LACDVACRKGQAAALDEAVRKAYGVDLPASSHIAQAKVTSSAMDGQWLAVLESQ
jgi:hypothetical protein